MTKKITEATARGTTASRGKPVDVFDTEVTGLYLRVTPPRKETPNGVRSWRFQYRVRSTHRQRVVTLGRYPALNVSSARAFAADLYEHVRRGGDPAKELRDQRAAPTFAQVWDRFMDEHVALLAPSTVARYGEHGDRFLLPRLGRLKVAEVGRDDAQRLHSELRRTRYMANAVLRTLSSVMNFAEKVGARPEGSNPTRHVARFKEEPNRRYLSPEEYSKLGLALDEVRADGSEFAGTVDLIRMLMFTGRRKGEIVHLTWGEVDLDRGVLNLRKTKTGAKSLRLPPQALAILSSLPRGADGDLVFPATGGGANENFHHAWKRLLKRAGVKHARVHDLRHSHASMAAAGGESLLVIAGMLAHSNTQTTQHYAHLSDDVIARAVNDTADRIEAAMSGSGGADVVQMTPKDPVAIDCNSEK